MQKALSMSSNHMRPNLWFFVCNDTWILPPLFGREVWQRPKWRFAPYGFICSPYKSCYQCYTFAACTAQNRRRSLYSTGSRNTFQGTNHSESTIVLNLLLLCKLAVLQNNTVSPYLGYCIDATTRIHRVRCLSDGTPTRRRRQHKNSRNNSKKRHLDFH